MDKEYYCDRYLLDQACAKLHNLQNKAHIVYKEIDTVQNKIEELKERLNNPFKDKLMKVEDCFIFKSGRKLRLHSVYFNNNSKTLFLINVETGSIYRGKITSKINTVSSYDLVVRFNYLTWPVCDLIVAFGLKQKDIAKIERG